MKKLSVILAISLLCGQVAHSQGLRIIPRAEYSTTGQEEEHLANSSLYTVFEGTISDNLSFYTLGHWLSSTPGDLYTNVFHSDCSSFIDMIYLTWSLDWVDINIGKQTALLTGCENDFDDFDCHYDLAGEVWNNVNVYQWGLSANFYAGDNHVIDVSAAASPFGERPFSSNLYSFGAGYAYTNGGFMARLRGNLIQSGAHSFKPLCFFSLRYDGDNWYVFNDLSYGTGDPENVVSRGYSDNFHFSYTFSEKWQADAVFTTSHIAESGFNTTKAGAFAYFFPIENLRIHALAGYDFTPEIQSPFFCIGLTYNLCL